MPYPPHNSTSHSNNNNNTNHPSNKLSKYLRHRKCNSQAKSVTCIRRKKWCKIKPCIIKSNKCQAGGIIIRNKTIILIIQTMLVRMYMEIINIIKGMDNHRFLMLILVMFINKDHLRRDIRIIIIRNI